VDALVADLIEPAKVIALEMVGEGDRVLAVAAGWVRSTLSVERTLAGITR